jgi:hypothetical protein
MFHPRVFAMRVAGFLSKRRFHLNSIRPVTPDQQLAPPHKISSGLEREPVLGELPGSSVRQSRHQ